MHGRTWATLNALPHSTNGGGGHKNSILTLINGRNSIANSPKFKLIQAFMHVLVTCKNEEDQIENEGARLFTRFLSS